MPCYQSSTYNGQEPAFGGYATEADCLQACKEGACCNGTTCSVKPQCQCDSSQGFGFQGVGTTCSPNPCNTGACCVGPTCYQRSEEQCAAGFNVGSFFNPQIVSGGFVGDNVPCSPNPCCPTCDPYVSAYNPVLQASGYTGKCCRSVYVNDGHGACCPPGRDCCGDRVFNSGSGADNGACCPESKPYCCEASNGSFVVRQCQAYPIVVGSFFGSLRGCDSPNLTKTLVLPSQPCTVQLNAQPAQVFGSRVLATGYKVRLQMGTVDEVRTVALVTTSPGGGGFSVPYCKPPEVTSATITISDLVVFSNNSNTVLTHCFEFLNSGGGTDYVSAWDVSMQVTFPCDCNPLP